MGLFDVVLLLPLAYGAWRGFKKGLIIEIFTLLAIVVGIYAAIQFSEIVNERINENIGEDYSSTPAIAFTLIFLAVGALIYFGGVAFEKVVKAVNLSPINRLLGLLFGVIKTIYIVSIVLVTYESYDPEGKLISPELRENSPVYNPLKNISIKTIPYMERSRLYLEGNPIAIGFGKEEGENSEVDNSLE